jgi:hypothetical protein
MAVERHAKPRDSADVPSIKELITAALDAGKTVRQLEADSGDRVRFQTFQELSKHPPKQFPKYAETITGMAAALNVSESTVVLAYATGLGIPVSAGPTFALRLPPGVDTIEPSMQDAIIQVARAALQSGRPRRLPVNSVTEDQSEQLSGPLAPFVETRGNGAPEDTGEDRRKHGQ